MNSPQVLTIRIDNELSAMMEYAMNMNPELNKSEIVRLALKDYLAERMISKSGENWKVNIPSYIAEIYTTVLEGGLYTDMNSLIVEAMKHYAEIIKDESEKYHKILERAVEQKVRNRNIVENNINMKLIQRK